MTLASAPKWSDRDHETWRKIVSTQAPRRARQAYPLFEEGLKALAMDKDQVPDLAKINQRLRERTGWEAVFVKGLEDGPAFYRLLAERRFPIGSFIRDSQDLNYTPEPDVVHDLYGHVPFLADPKYAEFSQRFGAAAVRHKHDAQALHEFERLYWFTYEFGLIKTPAGRRIFGAGILSSIAECEYALSEKPTVHPFDANRVRSQEFRIDQIQQVLFELESPDQLYSLY
jgi:phenylalanine-4-hydroxylase